VRAWASWWHHHIDLCTYLVVRDVKLLDHFGCFSKRILFEFRCEVGVNIQDVPRDKKTRPVKILDTGRESNAMRKVTISGLTDDLGSGARASFQSTPR
jgi:hypothetical protein